MIAALIGSAIVITAAVAPVDPAVATTAGNSGAGSKKPRIIVMQDGEVDDMDSFIRLLYYSNEFNIAGVVYTSSKYHWAGDGAQVAPYRWTGTKWVSSYLDKYATVYPNLRKHADGYPSPERLRSVYKVGNVENVGEMAKVTAGSELIRKAILDDDSSPLYLLAWGGNNTAARALKSIQEQYQGTARWSAIQQKVNKKVVIYNILNQDDTLSGYIKPNWPNIKIIDNQSQFWSFAYLWTRQVPAANQPYLRAPFMEQSLLTGKGSLLAEYRTYRDGKPTPGDDENTRWQPDANTDYAVHDFISEGDSPSFLYLLDFNGLRSSENPTFGGWGGRFAPSASGWIDTSDVNPTTGNADRAYPQTRWVADLQNDFAARASWGVSARYSGANHNPRAAVAEGTDLRRKPGAKVVLHGRGTDPDGGALSYRWWQYTDADSYAGAITLTGANSRDASFTVPADAKPGDAIHLILEVSDGGAPPLKHYQRVVVTVG
ncbi:DUF1593 domain-containing protein [Cryptosporangium phraense]|nr:DUF1593 domain-containing protein [Cryptosporangium phraense]